MRNVTEIQRRLIDLGFLPPRDDQGLPSDDGKFGQRSMDAYNRFLASKGKPPHQGMILLAELNANLFPEEQPSPIPSKPGPLAILSLIFDLSKGKPMKFSTIEQLIRIAAYTGGGMLFGQQIADGQMFQAAIGGAVALGAFVWWLVFERNRVAK
jgi:hypothetical protein